MKLLTIIILALFQLWLLLTGRVSITNELIFTTLLIETIYLSNIKDKKKWVYKPNFLSKFSILLTWQGNLIASLAAILGVIAVLGGGGLISVFFIVLISAILVANRVTNRITKLQKKKAGIITLKFR